MEHQLEVAHIENRQTTESIAILEHIVAVEKLTLNERDMDQVASEHQLALVYLRDKLNKEVTTVFNI